MGEESAGIGMEKRSRLNKDSLKTPHSIRTCLFSGQLRPTWSKLKSTFSSCTSPYGPLEVLHLELALPLCNAITFSSLTSRVSVPLVPPNRSPSLSDKPLEVFPQASSVPLRPRLTLKVADVFSTARNALSSMAFFRSIAERRASRPLTSCVEGGYNE